MGKIAEPGTTLSAAGSIKSTGCQKDLAEIYPSFKKIPRGRILSLDIKQAGMVKVMVAIRKNLQTVLVTPGLPFPVQLIAW